MGVLFKFRGSVRLSHLHHAILAYMGLVASLILKIFISDVYVVRVCTYLGMHVVCFGGKKILSDALLHMHVANLPSRFHTQNANSRSSTTGLCVAGRQNQPGPIDRLLFSLSSSFNSISTLGLALAGSPNKGNSFQSPKRPNTAQVPSI